DAWRALPTDEGAAFDREITVDAGALSPQVTWGTNPEMVVGVTDRVPEPKDDGDERALRYMALEPGTPMTEIRLDRVFIGSCTNSRIGDLRAAARVVDGRRVSPDVRAMVVPGSAQVKAQAEAEGLDRVFTAAGFDWRGAGCSMCLGMNPDIAAPGERVASTSNRNFEGRQGRGARSHLVSPQMAAAAAVEGHFVDIREWERWEPSRPSPVRSPSWIAATSIPIRSSPSSSSSGWSGPALGSFCSTTGHRSRGGSFPKTRSWSRGETLAAARAASMPRGRSRTMAFR